MSKIKIVTGIIIGFFVSFGLVAPAYALETKVSIQKLPGYINYNDFKLSCSAISDSLVNGDPTYAHFYFSKNGGSDTDFGPTLNLATTPCQVQVTSGQITEEANYTFKVTVDGKSDTTSTIFDNSGPSPVSGYYKESLSDGFKLHWTNPSDSDFSKVIIYRGDTPDFSADGSHQIVVIPSGGGSPMTYDDHFSVDPTKTYYYDIRTVDKAGNSSGLVGDGSSVTMVTSPSPIAGTSGVVTQLPKEIGTGSVLGTEATPSPEAVNSPTPGSGIVNQINQYASKTPEPFKWILTHKKISLGVLIILGLLAYNFYKSGKKSR